MQTAFEWTAVVGFTLLAILIIRFRAAAEWTWLSETWTKVAVELIQLAAGILGAYAFVSKDKGESWLYLLIAVSCCLTSWKLLQCAVDYRVKLTEKANRRTFDRVNAELSNMAEMLSVFQASVENKVAKVGREMERQARFLSVGHIRNALVPDEELDFLLKSLARLIAGKIGVEFGSKNANVRVGIYTEKDGVMVPAAAVDLNNPAYGTKVFGSHREHVESFRLNGSGQPAHAVTCILHKSTIVVEDCVKSEEAGEFWFYKPEQRSYLRSMIAHSMGEVHDESGATVRASLVIDTDIAGYFRATDIDSWKLILGEFCSRIRLERALSYLLRERKVSNEQPRAGRSRKAETAPPGQTLGGGGQGDPRTP